eukprot:1158671-Pelagomonas_calceolata.AAC.2
MHTQVAPLANSVAPLANSASVASVGDDGVLIIWDAGSGKKRHELQGHKPGMTYFGITGDGSQVRREGGRLTSAPGAQTLHDLLWHHVRWWQPGA